MRKLRENLPNRVYHLISRGYPPAVRLLAKRGAMRGAHQAFFLDDDEKTRAVELLRRVEEFVSPAYRDVAITGVITTI